MFYSATVLVPCSQVKVLPLPLFPQNWLGQLVAYYFFFNFKSFTPSTFPDYHNYHNYHNPQPHHVEINLEYHYVKGREPENTRMNTL